MEKNLPAMWEMQVPSLVWEDDLEKEMATHGSILVWRMPKDRAAWWATVPRVARELNIVTKTAQIQPISRLTEKAKCLQVLNLDGKVYKFLWYSFCFSVYFKTVMIQ